MVRFCAGGAETANFLCYFGGISSQQASSQSPATQHAWKCPRVHFFVGKSIDLLSMIVLAAIMRKMGARLVDSKTRVDQLTPFQKMLLAAYAVVAVLTLAFPEFGGTSRNL
jgi:hypothetical protein